MDIRMSSCLLVWFTHGCIRMRTFDEKVGGLVCEVSGRYRIEELESRLIRVINDLHQKTYGKYYLGELNFITEGITIEKRYGTALAALCLRGFPSTGGRGISRVEYFCDIYRAGSFQEPAFLLTFEQQKHINMFS